MLLISNNKQNGRGRKKENSITASLKCDLEKKKVDIDVVFYLQLLDIVKDLYNYSSFYKCRGFVSFPAPKKLSCCVLTKYLLKESDQINPSFVFHISWEAWLLTHLLLFVSYSFSVKGMLTSNC